MQRFFHCDLHPQVKHIDARAGGHASDRMFRIALIKAKRLTEQIRCK